MPELRVGIAFGTVTTRMGDVFGTTVNLASRLTSIAPKDAVLVDGAFAEELGRTGEAPVSEAEAAAEAERAEKEGEEPPSYRFALQPTVAAPGAWTRRGRALAAHPPRGLTPRVPADATAPAGYRAWMTSETQMPNRLRSRHGRSPFGEFVAVRWHGHVAELVLDRPKAMNAVSTEMARSARGGLCGAGGRHGGTGRGADLHPRAGLLRGRRPQGAQLLHRRGAGTAAADRPGRLHRGARTAHAHGRRGARLRAGRRFRAGAGLRSDRRGPRPWSGCPRCPSV